LKTKINEQFMYPYFRSATVGSLASRKTHSLRLAAAAVTFAIAGSCIEPAKAEFRWCSISNEGASSCSFTTIEQCRAAILGTGGFCMPQAPVGHRQPRASDRPATIPKDESDRRLEQQNRKLDRDLQLCRGC
jgi:hypothetical protein